MPPRDRRAEALAHAAALAEARALLRAGLREDVARYPYLRGGLTAEGAEALAEGVDDLAADIAEAPDA
jgi:hypothetical protein